MMKFANSWTSVRRSFLDLDFDHDGFVTAEDLLRYFGPSLKDVDFNDVKKLLKDKDMSKKGWLSYKDFSSWLGVCIHQSEGFFFRHDSIKNPEYEENLKRKYDRFKSFKGQG
jgi:hypothetical protein